MIGTAYAQASTSSAAPSAFGGEGLMGMLPIILMFVILYFLMIRPQMKKAKEHRTMLDALQKGDEVIAVGILGRIEKIGDSYLTLEIAPNVLIQVQKQAVTTLLPKGTVKDAR
jgi:preprotein translocase subunit YajC